MKASDLVPRKTIHTFPGVCHEPHFKDPCVSSVDYQASNHTIMGLFRAAVVKRFEGKAPHPGLLGAGTCHGVGVRAELLQAAGVRGHRLLEALQHRGPSGQAEEALGATRNVYGQGGCVGHPGWEVLAHSWPGAGWLALTGPVSPLV